MTRISRKLVNGRGQVGRELRAAGHRLRFLTNATTRSKKQLAADLQAMGIELDVSEVQTTADAAVTALRGKRVLALVMHALVHDLEELEIVGEGADAVLIGGADDSPETNLVFSYMNLARAFAELELGADLYGLHRNRWWQTERGPLLRPQPADHLRPDGVDQLPAPFQIGPVGEHDPQRDPKA